jgi:hypothetical protein
VFLVVAASPTSLLLVSFLNMSRRPMAEEWEA